MSQLAFSAKPNRGTDRIMKIRIFDQLDSRTSGCFETHLIILAVVAFGLTENLNYVLAPGVEGVSICTRKIHFTYCMFYRPYAWVTEHLVVSSEISLQKSWGLRERERGKGGSRQLFVVFSGLRGEREYIYIYNGILNSMLCLLPVTFITWASSVL